MAYVNELAGSKLRSKLGATLNEAVSAPTSAFAKKQLEKMGWAAGQGLGKNKQGMSSHIKVKKREDDVGLGHIKHELQTQQQWWNDSMGDVLAKLGGGGKAKKHMTDEDLYKATGGRRFGMRAQRKQKGKWARAETISEEAEQEAKSKVEWNGQGQAQILLKKKKKCKSDDDDEAPKKKKCKKSKDATDESVVDDVAPRKKEKKQKKQKKEKKEKKGDKKDKKSKKRKLESDGGLQDGELC
jgi:Pin2-interacting protein X1